MLHLLSSQSIKLFFLKKACLLVKYVNREEELLRGKSILWASINFIIFLH